MHRTILLAIGALSLAGCMHAREATEAHPGTGGSDMSSTCPRAVPGTIVSAQDVADGGALAFTTTQGDVAELRRRVAQMADTHNRYLAMHGSMQPGTGGAGPDQPLALNAQARVEDVEGGARIVYTPKDPAQVPALREELARDAPLMNSGHCPMAGIHQCGTNKSQP